MGCWDQIGEQSRPGAEGAHVLGGELAFHGTCGTEYRRDPIEQLTATSTSFYLDLAEARDHLASLEHIHIVVDQLGEHTTIRLTQFIRAPDGAHGGHGYERGRSAQRGNQGR